MSVLEDSWARARHRLSVVPTHALHDQNPRLPRVGQLDAELLDQELIQLLQVPLINALSLIRVSLKDKYEHELWLFVQLVLYKLSVWDTGASYGSKLQDLRYVTSRAKGLPTASSGIPRRTLVLHGLLTILIPYLHSRIRTHALSRAWPDAPSSDSRRKTWTFVTMLESTHGLLALLNFIAFLWNGRYRTIADRVLRMRLAPSRRLVKRDVSYEFMNRQMVWHAFTEFLIFLLPLINTRGIRRRLHRLLSSTSASFRFYLSSIGHVNHNSPREHQGMTRKRGKFWSLPRNQCAICAENASVNFNLSEPANVFSSLAAFPQQELSPSLQSGTDSGPPTHPLTVPYIVSCGDMYCYHCISERMIRAAEDGDSKWECLRCGELVFSAERFSVDVEGNETSNYDFSDEFESTDMSGSVDSYIYSESDNDSHS
ncbi:hypothetical protein APHAL10511_001959 [Amanita phalloides]|nr:hypothetical protein APHAL10511_001959 [Amanita phalloides]